MDIIIETIKKSGNISLGTIAKKLNISKRDKDILQKTLNKLEREGKIVCADGKYSVSEHTYKGKVCATISGVYFFESEELKNDLKIINAGEFCPMDNDIVLVRKSSGGARIISVLERANKNIVGEVASSRKGLMLIPDDKKIHYTFYLPKSERSKALVGDKVVAQIEIYPHYHADGTCKIEKNLGFSKDISTQIEAVLYSYNVRQEFPERVLDAADKINDEIFPRQLEGRLDLRAINCITIDGDDAKDLDDAVSLEITEGGDYLLGVHIADVAHFVKQDSYIDTEAAVRGTSVYIPGKVYPMLPKKLSNGVCSLNEGEERLTLSCFMVIDKNGQVKDYSINPSIICSKHRMTYSSVERIIVDKDKEEIKKFKDVYGMLLLMKSLSQILSRAAQKRGYIDFDLPEAKITLDENDFPQKIEKYYVGESNRLIENFMLLANTTVAAHMRKYAIPAIYRVHSAPEKEREEQFSYLCKKMGYQFEKESSPRQYQQMLDLFRDKPEENLMKKAMLRTMSKAKYKNVCEGHFGLAMENYLHFTSPIRRYPDLCVHRMLHYWFEHENKRMEHFGERLSALAQNSTQTEINAAQCERDIVDIRCAQYLSKRIGEEFDAVISGVTANGMFASLDNTAEGFIPIATLDGYYNYIEDEFALVGADKKYSLGDKIKIRVTSTDVFRGKSEFELIET